MRLPLRRPVFLGRSRQGGVALIVSLLMLVVIMLLGTSAGQISLLSERASRNDRDRLLAFQAAEAGLMDAELDIEHSPDAARSRSHIFSVKSALGFPGEGDEECRSGQANVYLGLCKGGQDAATPAWLTVDFQATAGIGARSVPYGMFTGQTLQTGAGALPSKSPRYIVELMLYNRQGESADTPSYFYRITAIGFGARDTTQVVLQTFYRKED